MPTYKVTSPDGKVLRLTGDKPPSKEQLDKIFSQVGGSAPSVSSADWTPAAQPGAEKQFAGGFLQRATAGIVNNSRAGQGAQNAQAVEVESVKKLQEAAMNEKDPTKRAAYQKLADDANARLQSNLSGRKGQLLGNTGWSAAEQNKYATDPLAYAGSIAKDAGQGAVDIGSVIAPPFKAVSGAGAMTKIATTGVNGLVGGTLAGAGRATQADSAGEALKDVATGAGLGLGTGVAVQGGIETLKYLKNSFISTALKNSASGSFDSLKAMFGGDKARATNEVLGFSKNKAIVQRAAEKGVDVTETSQKYIPKIMDKSQKGMLAKTEKLMDKSGKDIGTAIEKSKTIKTVDLDVLQPKVDEMIAKETSYGNTADAEKIKTIWDGMQKKWEPLKAWQLKTDFDGMLWSAAGKKKNIAPLSSGELQLRELVADHVRETLSSDKAVKAALKTYEELSPIRQSLFSVTNKVEGIPQAGINLFDKMVKGMSSGFSSPEALNKTITRPETKNMVLEQLLKMLSQGKIATKNAVQSTNRINPYGAALSVGMGQSAMDRASQN